MKTFKQYIFEVKKPKYLFLEEGGWSKLPPSAKFYLEYIESDFTAGGKNNMVKYKINEKIPEKMLLSVFAFLDKHKLFYTYTL